MKNCTHHFDAIAPFSLSVCYNELYADSPENVFEPHVHEECEIYINLSGDVSFVVENNIYPVKPGDVIITHPFEYHHCVYHSNSLHRHFWILFSAAQNEYLFSSFFKRNAGENNHLELSPSDTDALLSLCHQMAEEQVDPQKRYFTFFSIINLLQNAAPVQDHAATFPPDVTRALRYINDRLAEVLTARDIAAAAFVSVNTLERHFARHLQLAPMTYVKKKKLANAAKLLRQGFSVTDAATGSGFVSYSNFIALFKKAYGVTPLQYKNGTRKNRL